MKDRIKQVQKESGLNQEDFAKKIGISKSSVQKLQSGENNPSEQTIRMICSEFNVNRTWLETGEGEPYSIEAVDSVIDMLMVNETDFARDTFKQFFYFRQSLSDEDKEVLDKACRILLGIKKKEDE